MQKSKVWSVIFELLVEQSTSKDLGAPSTYRQRRCNIMCMQLTIIKDLKTDPACHNFSSNSRGFCINPSTLNAQKRSSYALRSLTSSVYSQLSKVPNILNASMTTVVFAKFELPKPWLTTPSVTSMKNRVDSDQFQWPCKASLADFRAMIQRGNHCPSPGPD